MPEPTNAARELAATGTPGPWSAHDVSEWIDTSPTWEVYFIAPEGDPIVGGEEVAVANYVEEADADKIARAVNALGPLGDLLDAIEDHTSKGGIWSCSGRTDWCTCITQLAHAVEAALRGEQP